ncbi:MAG TPA: transglycosylase SLT domain-containing protein [Flexivirga sp.]|uniref:lytic transglycosylase n=1 Tax=Flexivirga sp. TaxID=1962927 RepID=UPI002B7A2829|nr:transglycosylase SLT domain-containing protein [Flexivirga sp.]HWC20745.1 transglycosylase SLT domain-containing protein [Flexivirga sp.]
MPPLTTGAPPAAVHAIHAQAGVNTKKASQHATKVKSKSPRLHPRRSTSVAKKATRIASPYRVQRGDNLTSIAARQHVSVAALIKANGIANPNRVLSGSVLRIPHRAAPHKAAPPKKATAGKTPRRTAKKTPAATGTSARTRATRAAIERRAVPSRTQTKAMIERTARKYGVNPRLALGISWQESGWNQRVVSPVNAIGTMQVLPQSGEWASAMVGRNLDLTDTQDNITAGVAILRYLTSNATSLDQAIGGYYQGLAGVKQHGAYAETKHYVRNVRALMERL